MPGEASGRQRDEWSDESSPTPGTPRGGESCRCGPRSRTDRGRAVRLRSPGSKARTGRRGGALRWGAVHAGRLSERPTTSGSSSALTRPSRPRTRSLRSSGKRHHPRTGGWENLVRGSRESASEARDENHRQQVHASDGKAEIKQHRKLSPRHQRERQAMRTFVRRGGAVLRRSAVVRGNSGRDLGAAAAVAEARRSSTRRPRCLTKPRRRQRPPTAAPPFPFAAGSAGPRQGPPTVLGGDRARRTR